MRERGGSALTSRGASSLLRMRTFDEKTSPDPTPLMSAVSMGRAVASTTVVRAIVSHFGWARAIPRLVMMRQVVSTAVSSSINVTWASAQSVISCHVRKIHLSFLGSAKSRGSDAIELRVSPDTRVGRRPTPFDERWIDAWRRNNASPSMDGRSGSRPPLSTRSSANGMRNTLHEVGPWSLSFSASS